jgi:hypothetical protein
MSKQLRRVLSLAVVVVLLGAAAALAAGPKKGATYTGTTVQNKESIALKVSHNGKSVTVTVQSAPLYCEGGGAGERQITKPAPIGKDGSFKGSITYEFTPTHEKTTRLYFSGKFSGKSVKGSARSEFGLVSAEAHSKLQQCDGRTSYSAKTK